MNYLELCQEVVTRAGIPAGGPASVIDQTGILSRVVTWVDDAYKEIQSNERWWSWRLDTGNFTLLVGTDNYDLNAQMPTDFGYLWEDQVYLLLDGLRVDKLTVIDWDQYVEEFLYEERPTQQPSKICLSPTGRIYFDAKPDQAYTVAFTYQKAVQTLAANADIPILPLDFHDVIWRRALISYGEHYNAPEVYRPTSLYLEQRMDILEATYLPKMKFRDNVYAST